MNTEDMSFSRNDTNMVIFESIDDPNGDFGVPAPAGAAPVPPVPPVPAPAPAGAAPVPPVPPVPAPAPAPAVQGIDEDVHAFVRDVQVGEETLVVNPILNAEEGTDADQDVLDDADDGIDEDGFEDAEAIADVQEYVQAAGLQETPLVNPTSLLSNTKFTATIGPFDVAPIQPVNTVILTTTPMVISTHERLVKPALEAVNRPQTAAKVFEKADGESVEEPALKRQAVEKDPASTLNQAGPSKAQERGRQ